jgi:hypothetical protein
LAADKARDPGVRLALLSLATNYIALADYADRQHERGTVTRDDKNKRKVKPGANAAIS